MTVIEYKIGRHSGARTHDFQITGQMLYQLRYNTFSHLIWFLRLGTANPVPETVQKLDSGAWFTGEGGGVFVVALFVETMIFKHKVWKQKMAPCT